MGGAQGTPIGGLKHASGWELLRVSAFWCSDFTYRSLRASCVRAIHAVSLHTLLAPGQSPTRAFYTTGYSPYRLLTRLTVHVPVLHRRATVPYATPLSAVLGDLILSASPVVSAPDQLIAIARSTCWLQSRSESRGPARSVAPALWAVSCTSSSTISCADRSAFGFPTPDEDSAVGIDTRCSIGHITWRFGTKRKIGGLTC